MLILTILILLLIPPLFSNLHKIVLDRYLYLKQPIIIHENYNLDFCNDYSWLNTLILHLNFVDYFLILVILLIIRFLSWRAILFIYILYIWLQCLLIKRTFFKSTRKNIDLELEYYNLIIQDFLSLLLLPFGSKIVPQINNYLFTSSATTMVYTKGGGGFIHTQSGVISNKKGWFKEESIEVSTPSTNFMKNFTSLYFKQDFNKCTKLVQEASLTEGIEAMKWSNYFLNNKGNIKKFHPDINTKDFIEFYQLFRGDCYYDIFSKIEPIKALKYIIPKEKYRDLNSLDSSQKEVSVWPFLWLSNKKEQEKFQELLNIEKFFKSTPGEIFCIVPVAERGTRTDVYVVSLPDKDVSLLSKVGETKAKFTYKELEAVLPVNSTTIIGVDSTRIRMRGVVSDLISEIYEQKLNSLRGVVIPQEKHYICAALTNVPNNEIKEEIDLGVRNIIKDLPLGTNTEINWKSITELF